MAETAGEPMNAYGGSEPVPLELGQFADPEHWIDGDAEPEAPSAPLGRRIAAGALVVLVLGWLATVGWLVQVEATAGRATLDRVALWIAAASAPVALAAILWMLLQRTSRREAARFGRTAEGMRAEAKRLDYAIRMIRLQLDEMRASISAESGRLAAIGEEAADRLVRVRRELNEAGTQLDEKSDRLLRSARGAREDIEVLVRDLPRADEQARALGGNLQDAGMQAHEQVAALEAQLTSLRERGREADEIASGAAHRLAAGLARIEGASEAAAARFAEAGTRANEAVGAAIEEASAAVDDTRRAVDGIAHALTDIVDGARTSFDEAGKEAALALAQRVEAVGNALGGIEQRLAAQSDSTGALLAGVEERALKVTQRIGAIGEAASVNLQALREHFAQLSGDLEAIYGNIEGSDQAAHKLIESAVEVKAMLDLSADTLHEALPESFAVLESRAGELHEAVNRIGPELIAYESATEKAAGHVAATGSNLAGQHEEIERVIAAIDERIGAMQRSIETVGTSLAGTDEQARSIADSAAPRLVEALMRVRETAEQAAEKARAAFGEVIPETAAALGEATRQAMGDALDENVDRRLAEIAEATERAVEAARLAAERLGERIAEIETTSAAIEDRIDEARSEAEAAEQDSFARRVTLLIESLNSTAIDVTKILSNEVTDLAWAAYLKGDRGIFARRAVRLLDTGEAREIAQHYESDAEFREQVNRYIHDFEAMLRRVLATRDGSALAVTLLSSDNGKLYVALAQAIERLRA